MGELEHPNSQLCRNGRRASGGAPESPGAMSLHDKGNDRTLEARIRAARAREFVGRTAEQTLFRSSLETDPADPTFTVLWVHGPGGIGKSALLERFAEDAQAVHRPVVRVDGRAIDATSGSFAGFISDPKSRIIPNINHTTDQKKYRAFPLEDILYSIRA